MRLTDAQLEKLRQSGIRLDADGRFWHEGQEVTHHGLRAAFWRWLDQNPDGRYVLRLDERRFVYLDVDDAPFVVRSLRWEDGRALLRLSDDSEEPLDAAKLMLKKGVAYARVKGGRFEARFSTAAWGVLAARVTEKDGVYYLDAEGGPYRLGSA